MNLPMWERLKCDCGGEIFVEAKYIKSHSTGGTTSEPAGYMCVACQLFADLGYLQKKLKIKHAEAQIEEAKEEIASLAKPEAKKPEPRPTIV